MQGGEGRLGRAAGLGGDGCLGGCVVLGAGVRAVLRGRRCGLRERGRDGDVVVPLAVLAREVGAHDAPHVPVHLQHLVLGARDLLSRHTHVDARERGVDGTGVDKRVERACAQLVDVLRHERHARRRRGEVVRRADAGEGDERDGAVRGVRVRFADPDSGTRRSKTTR